MQTTTYTNVNKAYAVFRFKGSAIYYGGYGESVSGSDKPGTIRVQLDNVTVDVSANIDPQHPAQQILFSQKGLDPNIEHMIYLQKISESGKRDLNIDFFTYTVPEGLNDTQIIIPFVPAATDAAAAPLGMILGGIFGGVIGAMLLVILVLWYLNRQRRQRTLAAALEAKYHSDSDPLMAANAWEYPPTPSRLPSGYATPPLAPTPSSYSTYTGVPSQYVTTQGRGSSGPSASTATGEPWLSPNTTPMTGVFAPGITSASTSAALPLNAPPPLYAESTANSGGNRR